MATVPCPMYILCILTRVWHNSTKTCLQVKLHQIGKDAHMHARYILRVSHIPHIVLCWFNLAVHGMWPNSRTIWPVSVCQQAWVQCYILGSPIKTYCDVWIQVQYNNYYVYTMYPTLCDTCFIVVWHVRTLGYSWCKSHVHLPYCVVWVALVVYIQLKWLGQDIKEPTQVDYMSKSPVILPSESCEMFAQKVYWSVCL